MSTLTEIEAAADALTPELKQELLLFLAKSLRTSGAPIPSPRIFPADQLATWIAEDEADMQCFHEAK